MGRVSHAKTRHIARLRRFRVCAYLGCRSLAAVPAEDVGFHDTRGERLPLAAGDRAVGSVLRHRRVSRAGMAHENQPLRFSK